MKEQLKDLSCTDFTAILASREPVPGGGGSSAMVGALGVALCSMVGNLTVGRKRYAQYEDDLNRILIKAETLRQQLLSLIDEDAKAFEPLSKAYSIPKEDLQRQVIMEKVLTDACTAPLEIMFCCCRAIEFLEEMLDKGSVTLISDVGCGVLFAKAALESASLNIFINTASLSDRSKAADIEIKADDMLKDFSPRAERVAKKVADRIRKGG